MATTILALATTIWAIGFLVLRANPNRSVNQAFGFLCGILGVWFLLVYQAVKTEDIVAEGGAANPEIWLKGNCIVAAFFPASIAWVKSAIAGASLRTAFKQSLVYFAAGAALVPLCLHHAFLLPPSDSPFPRRGALYFLYISLLLTLFITVVVNIYICVRSSSGIRRIEMQFLAFAMGAACSVGALCVAVGNYLHRSDIRRSSILFFIAAYLFTAWTITAQRIFSAKQILLLLCQRGLLVVAFLTTALSLSVVISSLIDQHSSIIISAACCVFGVSWLQRVTGNWLGISDERILAQTRSEVIDIARSEIDWKRLVTAFEHALCRQYKNRTSVLLPDVDGIYNNGAITLVKTSRIVSTLSTTGWATPEMLQRRRTTESLIELNTFLDHHSLSAIVAVPSGSVPPPLIVALGQKISGEPFTYPEIRRIQNIAELMDNILTRSRLATQAALKAKTEHLTMMTRGLAHDLKNLLTPVSSFLHHTEGRFPRESREGEVHFAAQRSVRIIEDYVREAGFFADRFALRLEATTLGPLFERVRETTATRADSHAIAVRYTIAQDGEFVADAVLLQRLLANLIHNAIDATPRGKTVELTGEHRGTSVHFQVVDEGCGIPRENLKRIYEPYFTTKEFGSELRGLGLGLTICQKIVALHHGTISAESELGHGTTFTVELPAQSAAEASR